MEANSPLGAQKRTGNNHSTDATATDASMCCVALQVQETQDRPEGDVAILSEIPRVAIGEPEVTLRGLIAYRFTRPVRDRILDRIDEGGPIDPTCPLSLERLQVWDDGLAVHLQAYVLPISETQTDELNEFLRDPGGPQLRHELAWEYAQDLVEMWCRRMPGSMRVRFLDDGTVEKDHAVDAAPCALVPPPVQMPLPAL